MSLSMHDRRVLADIEERLTEHDPQLALMLSSFGKATPLRTGLPRLLLRRHAVLLATALFLLLAALLLVAAVAVRSPVVFIAAVSMAGASASPKLIGFWLRRPRTRRAAG
ncbi:DUF3040 domain-containing protein [Streptomyces sp. RB6PN25]|uniref:DUF3040 domain-containing protein n=1 Tax=Streptomyces humicola TaxID=2953240 RepID=A0ABT1PN82_9ACTN|nr:DUF3040 domain-containing protein [Streptomyces humicola]MCQ4079140.1 DUF3040 domain-containing protein [Streptomyces humicola]